MIAKQLENMGFTSLVDFECQDDSDGRGPYIRNWMSKTPCPLAEKISEPQDDAFKANKARAVAEAAKPE